MAYKVKADSLFWDAVDEVNNGLVLSEIYQILFTLVENGPALEDATPIDGVPIGPVSVPGWSVPLPSDEGFIVYVSPETLGHDYIYVYRFLRGEWG